MADYDLYSIAFPTLDDAQIDELSRCGSAVLKHYQDGDVLIAVHQRHFPFFIIKSGEVEIIDTSGDQPRLVVTHRQGGFVGDVSYLTGNPSIVRAVARGDCEIYEIPRDDLRRVLNQCPTFSDIILQAFIARRQLLRESRDFIGLRVIGSRYSADTFRIRDFLARNHILFTWFDVETDAEVQQLLKHFELTEADTPVVACSHKLLLRNPTNRELADKLGIRKPLDYKLYDLVVVGAGPAGLAAAVYGASEGLRTAVLERSGPGGQAGSSMRIENYLGFPTGITGSELADRATLQANKFGAYLSIPSSVAHLSFDKVYPILQLEDGQTITTKCLLIASGADYRKLDVDNCDQFEGKGVYYAATPNEAQLCRGKQVIVVGGGNSAGQAAVFLAGHASKVLLLIRGNDLYKNMSSYLAERILQTSNIELCVNTTIQSMSGEHYLDSVTMKNHETEEQRIEKVSAVFSFIGATPRTDWLPEEIERDAKGFIVTGTAVTAPPSSTLQRRPFLLETSRRGIFAAGDVRAGSVKRVASAVGEGAMAVQFVHEYLKEI